MTFLALASLAAVLWGIDQYLKGANSKIFSALTLIFWYQLLALPVALVIFALGAETAPPLKLIYLAGLSSLAIFAAQFLYFSAMKHGQVSVVAAITASYPLFAAGLLGLVGIGEFSLAIGIGAAIVFLGVAAISPLGKINRPGQGVALGLGAALIYGIWAASDSAALQISGSEPADFLAWTILFQFLLSPVALCLARRKNQFRAPAGENEWLRLIGSVLLDCLALIVFYTALSLGNPIEAVIIASAYPLVTFLICLATGRESFSGRRLAAIGTIVVGVILVIAG